MKGKTVLITGATGLIGSTLVKYLAGYKCHLILPVRDIPKAKSMFSAIPDITYIEHDFSKAQELGINNRVDYIIHAACPTTSLFMVENPVETIDTIINGTRSILEFAKKSNIKGMVYLSSMEVYGEILDDSIPVKEDIQGFVNPLAARSSYPMGKRMAESLCYAYYKEYNVPVTIARLTQTFGPGVRVMSDNRIFAQFARCAINGNDIELATKGGTKRMYLHTYDAVDAIICMLKNGEPGNAYNVANDDSYISILEMAEFVRSQYNPKIKVIFKQKDQHEYLNEIHLRLSTEKIRHLGWVPKYSLRDMFDSIINVY